MRSQRRTFTKDRKSTRLNSSHQLISYAVFCLKKKKCFLPASARPPAGEPTHPPSPSCACAASEATLDKPALAASRRAFHSQQHCQVSLTGRAAPRQERRSHPRVDPDSGASGRVDEQLDRNLGARHRPVTGGGRAARERERDPRFAAGAVSDAELCADEGPPRQRCGTPKAQLRGGELL